jgi:hypothetical protein
VWGQQEVVFHDGFETGDTSGWWAPARAGKTGQVTCYDQTGAVIPCAGTGQDGDLLPGVEWPNPRFVDNGDGTVTDLLSGLVWLKSAECFLYVTWMQALSDAGALANGACGLSDGSVAGQWRLPSINELHTLVDYEFIGPAVSNTTGAGQWSEGDPFSGVRPHYYWSSTTCGYSLSAAWVVYMDVGNIVQSNKLSSCHVWPVRNGQ